MLCIYWRSFIFAIVGIEERRSCKKELCFSVDEAVYKKLKEPVAQPFLKLHKKIFVTPAQQKNKYQCFGQVTQWYLIVCVVETSKPGFRKCLHGKADFRKLLNMGANCIFWKYKHMQTLILRNFLSKSILGRENCVPMWWSFNFVMLLKSF